MRMPRTLTCPRPGPEAGDDQLLTLSLETRLCSRLTAVLQVAAPLSVSAALGALRDEGCQPLHSRPPIGPSRSRPDLLLVLNVCRAAVTQTTGGVCSR